MAQLSALPHASETLAAVAAQSKTMSKQSKAVEDDDLPPVRQVPDVRKLEIVFDEELGRDQPGKRLVRYQMNPRENWGPMAKAKGKA